MKRKSILSGRFALTGIAAATLCLAAPSAMALGLGRLNVQSALGETMQAEIEVTSLSPEEQSNLRIRIAPPEAYRAAGVDYAPVLPSARASLQRRADGRTFIRIVSDRGVHVCPILIEAPDARLGSTLTESLGAYPLRHHACYTCYQYGALCANPSEGRRDA